MAVVHVILAIIGVVIYMLSIESNIVARVIMGSHYHYNYGWNKVYPTIEISWPSATLWTRPQAPHRRPNIILIVADDLGINDLYGDHENFTRNIRSIASQGVNFTQSYAGHATCAPSRASIMTGKFSTRFGFEFTPVPAILAQMLETKSNKSISKPLFAAKSSLADMNVPITEKLLPEILQESGYDTYFFGKWHLGEAVGSRPHERGFRHSLSFLHGASQYLRPESPQGVKAVIPDCPLDAFLWSCLPFSITLNGGQTFTPGSYMTDYLADQAALAIAARSTSRVQKEQQETEPYFMQVSFNAPHNPLHALKEDFESEELDHIIGHRERVYAAMILALDRGVGTILQAVETSTQGDNTLIIFTSDNGGASYLGLPYLNSPFRGWKATLFEGGIRVPLFMKWPQMIDEHTIVEAMVGHVDIFATITAAAGIELPSNQTIDGVDLTSLATAVSASASVSTSTSESTEISAHKQLFWRSGHYKAIRFENWKLQTSSHPMKMWLFRLDVDPTETNNLAANVSLSSLEYDTASHNDTTATSEDDIRQIKDGEIDSITLHKLLRFLLARLNSIDEEQQQSLWQSSSESIVFIDHPSFSPATINSIGENIDSVADAGGEYIYWQN